MSLAAPPNPDVTSITLPPAPERKVESWRFADLSQLKSLEGLRPASQIEGATRKIADFDEVAGRFVFSNGKLLSSESASLPEGVIALSLVEAREKHGALVDEHFMAQPFELGSAAYAELHREHTEEGMVLYVPAGVVIEKPIEVTHFLTGENAVLFPHTLIVAEANSRVSVVERFVSSDDETAGFSVGVCDLIAKDGAQIRYANIQRWNGATKAIQISNTSAGKDADVKSFTLNLGGTWVRNEATSHLNGAGANSDMLSVNVASGSQQFDQRTLQLHHAPNTTSDLLYKNALYDTSKTVFAGLIVVDDGAHGTDAYQTCRNLFLSDDAEANSMPGLEINADQVKCSHGSTSGQIEEDELFYFLARGIKPDTARQLITLGFTAEVVEKLDDPLLEAFAIARIEEKFANLKV